MNADYVAGSHHYWMHFWCDLIFGAGLGAWMGWWIFDSGWRLVVTAIVVSLAIAYSCGRWGDRNQGNSKRFGGEVVHRVLLGLVVDAPAPGGEQLRRTYTER